MKFLELKSKLKSNDLIDIRNIINLFGHIDRRRLYEWQKKGYIQKLTNNYYIFTDADISDVMLRMIANKIYAPSYIGLESALSYYELIPEAVFQITSVTSRKTRNIKTNISDFNYRSIQKRLFWGYTVNTESMHAFFISDPAKTLLDYLYLNPHLDNEAAFNELRFNHEEMRKILNPSRLRNYLKLFSHNRLSESLNKLLKVLNVKF
ncbi:MAG: hypothetical protein DRP85_04345 [Candidatus Makaraimicrobium thalassicum]|nr:MAG: hypothetical protein DRP85_04345 [Candidatus Omnitrophota bacterium]